jgi:hypothetical protein
VCVFGKKPKAPPPPPPPPPPPQLPALPPLETKVAAQNVTKNLQTPSLAGQSDDYANRLAIANRKSGYSSLKIDKASSSGLMIPG